MSTAAMPAPRGKIYRPIRTIADLGQHLQWALSLELSTIPPYLCALYSISDTASAAYSMIRSIAVEEMLHMMQAANLMNAIGVRPSLAREYVPAYPGFMRHHAAGGPYIQLMAFSPELCQSVFMAIEQPEISPHAPAEGDYFETIGQFYKAIAEGFAYCVEEFGEAAVFGNDTGFQRADTYFGSGGGRLHVVHDLRSALAAINEITQQGEGAPLAHPPLPGEERLGGYDHYGPRLDGTYGPILGIPWELSHYNKFRQLATGEVHAPDAYPMVANPSTSDYMGETRRLSELFDTSFTLVIQTLELAFTTPPAQQAAFFGVAFPVMHAVLPAVAILLMRTPLHAAADPALGPTAGPGFAHHAMPVRQMLENAEYLQANPPALGTAYMEMWRRHLSVVCRTLAEAVKRAEQSGTANLGSPGLSVAGN